MMDPGNLKKWLIIIAVGRSSQGRRDPTGVLAATQALVRPDSIRCVVSFSHADDRRGHAGSARGSPIRPSPLIAWRRASPPSPSSTASSNTSNARGSALLPSPRMSAARSAGSAAKARASRSSGTASDPEIVPMAQSIASRLAAASGSSCSRKKSRPLTAPGVLSWASVSNPQDRAFKRPLRLLRIQPSMRCSSPDSIRARVSLAPPISVPLTNTIGKVGQPVHILSALRRRHEPVYEPYSRYL